MKKDDNSAPTQGPEARASMLTDLVKPYVAQAMQSVGSTSTERTAGAEPAPAEQASREKSLLQAARAVLRVALDDVEVHPCDHGDDSVAARQLSPELTSSHH